MSYYFFCIKSNKIYLLTYSKIMLSNLAKNFNVPKELKEKEKLKLLSKGIVEQIQNENNIFKCISLIGINNILRIIKFCPGLQYYSLLDRIYLFFENYYFNNFDTKKENDEIHDIIKKIENNFKLSELINSLIHQKNERILLYLFGIINLDNNMMFLFIIFCLINNKIKIIFEYDELLSSSYIGLYKIVKLFLKMFMKK